MAKVEILAVGSELFFPDRQDGNGPWLTEQLNLLGLEVQARILVEDRLERLTAAFQQSLSQADLVIATGGLGPTEDDLTRQAAAQALGLELDFEESLWADILAKFARLGRVPSENNRRQAELLRGATSLPNPKGTAPGQWLSPRLALLPGPPREMQPMYLNYLQPALEGLALGQLRERRTLRVFGLGESILDERLEPLYREFPEVTVSTLFSALDVEVHLSATQGHPQLPQMEEAASQKLGDYCYSQAELSLAGRVGQLLDTRSLASAEWGSLGYLAQRLSRQSAYRGGRVEGPRLGAQELREQTGCDYALTLCIQEGAQSQVELATSEEVLQRTYPTYGDGETLASRAAQQALDLLRRYLLGLPPL
jgi:nicotinamide-nucleotide amidase